MNKICNLHALKKYNAENHYGVKNKQKYAPMVTTVKYMDR